MRVGGEAPSGNCTRTEGHFLCDFWGGVPKDCPIVPGKWSRGPHSPSAPLPCLGRQKCLPGQLWFQCCHREVASRILPGCDFIHCFVSQCQSAVFHIIPGPQLQLGEESSACSTGWGYYNLLFLLAACLLLPQRSLSPQMLSMLECGFVFCDHSIQTLSP